MKEIDAFDFGDIGNIDIPDIDTSIFGIVPPDAADETRYTPPMVAHTDDVGVFEYAMELAERVKISDGLRVDVFVSGNFIFGDFIEAFLLQNNARADEMTISTLSYNQNNIDSLAALMRNDYIGNLNIVASAYFFSMERHSLVPYTYKELDIDDRFQFAAAGIHTKTVHFLTRGGKKIVIHGSANLRSSGNIEQFTIEENPKLYDFYESKYKLILEKYKTIRHEIRRAKAWDLMASNNL